MRLYRWRVGEDLWTDLGLTVLGEEGLAVSGRTVYIAGNDGKLLRSFDEGDTWTDVSQRLPNWDLQSKRNYQQVGYDLHFVGETIYAGSDYRVLRSTDGDGLIIMMFFIAFFDRQMVARHGRQLLTAYPLAFSTYNLSMVQCFTGHTLMGSSG